MANKHWWKWYQIWYSPQCKSDHRKSLQRKRDKEKIRASVLNEAWTVQSMIERNGLATWGGLITYREAPQLSVNWRRDGYWKKQERGAFGVPKDETLIVKVKSKRGVGCIQLSAFRIWRLYGDEWTFSWSVCFAAVEEVLSMEEREVPIERTGTAVEGVLSMEVRGFL